MERRSCRSILRPRVISTGSSRTPAGNGKGVHLCCFGEVAWVENAFCKHDIQLDLVFYIGEDDLLRWSLHIECQFIDAT